MKKWSVPSFEALEVKATAENGSRTDGLDAIWQGAGPNGEDVWTFGPKSGSGVTVYVKVSGSAAEELMK